MVLFYFIYFILFSFVMSPLPPPPPPPPSYSGLVKLVYFFGFIHFFFCFVLLGWLVGCIYLVVCLFLFVVCCFGVLYVSLFIVYSTRLDLVFQVCVHSRLTECEYTSIHYISYVCVYIFILVKKKNQYYLFLSLLSSLRLT